MKGCVSEAMTRNEKGWLGEACSARFLPVVREMMSMWGW